MKPPSLIVVVVGLILASAIGGYRKLTERVNRPIPDHLLGHPVIDKSNFLSPDITRRLRELARQIKIIPSAQREGASMKIYREHIGEAVPFDGVKCPSMMVPNSARTMCTLPQRVDVARHYFTSGGPEAKKEFFELAATRVQTFLAYLFNYEQYPVAKQLLESKEFIELAVAVCPKHQQFLDPIQLNIVVNVPGQTVATHVDAPYFWGGGNRFRIPIWLLASMVTSGLFTEHFVSQVQVVGYFHTWGDDTAAPSQEEQDRRAGRFMFWDTAANPQKPGGEPVVNAPKFADPLPRSANSMDGSKVLHAAGIYYPSIKPPLLQVAGANELAYDADLDKWHVKSNGNILRTYNETDLRFSVVYRARCFADQAERDKYHALEKKALAVSAEAAAKGGPDVDKDGDVITVEKILAVFREDLVKRGHFASLEEANAATPNELASLILDVYTVYPYSTTSLLPFNYCSLALQYPWLKTVLSLVCDG